MSLCDCRRNQYGPFWGGSASGTYRHHSTTVELNDLNQIVQQVDVPDASDVFATIVSQVLRLDFGTNYHIGNDTIRRNACPKFWFKKNTFHISCSDIMPWLVYTSHHAWTHSKKREDAYANIIPHHAFCDSHWNHGTQMTAINPQLLPSKLSSNGISHELHVIFPLPWSFLLALTWPFQARTLKHFPRPCQRWIEFQSKWRVATVVYGGSPQDGEVAELRKTLYQKVVKDGFFLQNDAKAYYTEEGLGMGVYDWRPKFRQGQ